jgi:phosphoglucomutase
MMAGFRENPPSSINDSRVVKIHDYLEQQSLDRITGESSPIELPVSNVLQFILEDGSNISVRPSGTEPKIKFYFSVAEKLGKLTDFQKIQAVLNERILKQKKSLKLV